MSEATQLAGDPTVTAVDEVVLRTTGRVNVSVNCGWYRAAGTCGCTGYPGYSSASTNKSGSDDEQSFSARCVSAVN